MPCVSANKAGAKALAAGKKTSDEKPRMSLSSMAKREHARRRLMSGFVRGQVLGGKDKTETDTGTKTEEPSQAALPEQNPERRESLATTKDTRAKDTHAKAPKSTSDTTGERKKSKSKKRRKDETRKDKEKDEAVRKERKELKKRDKSNSTDSEHKDKESKREKNSKKSTKHNNKNSKSSKSAVSSDTHKRPATEADGTERKRKRDK